LSQPAVQEKTVGTNGAARGSAEKVSQPCFNAIVEHWFKARIDGPMQTLAHYDETVKQLVTLGGLLPVILVAAYQLFSRPTPQTTSLLDVLTQPSPTTPTLWEVLKQPSTILFALFVVGFCAFIGCLIKACGRRLETAAPEPEDSETADPETASRTESCEVYKLLERAAEGRLLPEEVGLAVKDWNKHVDSLIKYKHYWVKWASISLTASTLCLMFLLFATAMRLV
jgi:hypothetical protein